MYFSNFREFETASQIYASDLSDFCTKRKPGISVSETLQFKQKSKYRQVNIFQKTGNKVPASVRFSLKNVIKKLQQKQHSVILFSV